MTKINNQGFDLGCFFVVLCAVTGKPEKLGFSVDLAACSLRLSDMI